MLFSHHAVQGVVGIELIGPVGVVLPRATAVGVQCVSEIADRHANKILGDDVHHAVPRVVRAGFSHAVGQSGRHQVAVGIVGVAGDAALGVGDLDDTAERVIGGLGDVFRQAGA